LNRSPDASTVKRWLDCPIRGSWKALKIKADTILARDKWLAQLLNDPGARRMFRHTALKNAPPVMRNNEKQ
jgi:hypothetical protein